MPASEALPRSSRLRRRADFLRIQGDGARVSARHFHFLLARAEATSRRLGLVVSKKIGCAVDRNRVKRLCRELFRRRFRLDAGIDLVVVARPGVAALPAREMLNEWEGAWANVTRRARILLAQVAPAPHVTEPLQALEKSKMPETRR